MDSTSLPRYVEYDSMERYLTSQRNPGPVILPILGRKPDPEQPGIPIDVSPANLFDTAYVHSWLRQNDSLLWWYYYTGAELDIFCLVFEPGFVETLSPI